MAVDLMLKEQIGSFSPELEALRQKARSQVELAGFPSRKDEDWRYAPLSTFRQSSYSRVLTNQKISLREEDSAYRLFIPVGATGLHSQDMQCLEGSGLAIHFADKGDLSFFDVRDQDFSSQLNQAAAGTVLVLRVSKGKTVPKPIVVEYLVSEEDRFQFGACRLIVDLQENAQLSLIESPCVQFNGFLSLVTRVDLARNSKLEILKNLRSTAMGQIVHHLDARLEASATLQDWSLSIGGGLHRFEGKIKLCGEGSQANLQSLTLLANQEVTDYQLCVDHRAAHTVSRQLFKCILADRSRAVFNGKIQIQKDCHHVDSHQMNKTLLLSEKAEIDTKPQLEVYNDDVKAGHGAAIGRLNAEELFYLQSRAIEPDQAVPLLLKAFLDDVLLKIPEQLQRSQMALLFADKARTMRTEEAIRGISN